jgi:Acetyltransferase (GNAT) domain
VTPAFRVNDALASENSIAAVPAGYVISPPKMTFHAPTVIAVLEYGLGSIGLDRVIAVVIPENVASCRVAEKAGMRFEGIATYYGIAGLKKYVGERGQWSLPYV